MSHRRGRKRNLEKELDEIILQDSQNILDTAESSSEPMSLGDIATSTTVSRSHEPPNPDHPDDSFSRKTTKG